MSFAALVAGLGADAAGQAPIWTRQATSSAGDYAAALAPDGQGGVFVAGATNGSMVGQQVGGTDAWIARYDASGTRLWGRQFGSLSLPTEGRALASDQAGGAFMAGYTHGNVGGGSAGGVDAWVTRYDAVGTRVWIQQFGTSATDQAWAAASDGAGGVYVCGATAGSLGGPLSGTNDVWLARYDSAGSRLWLRQFGSTSGEQALALAPDAAGGVFVGGSTGGALGGPILGGSDGWIAHYDAGGNSVWVRQFGTVADDQVYGLSFDGTGSIFAVGQTKGGFGAPNSGVEDAWIGRFDAAGNLVWVRQLGTSAYDECVGISAYYGGAIAAGRTRGNLAGPNAGIDDVWFAAFSAEGAQRWLHQTGTSGFDRPYDLIAGPAGSFYSAGDTSGTFGGPSFGSYDGWVGRFSAACFADCNLDGLLNLSDFGCFQTGFALGDPYADCNGDGVRNLSDFGCFQTKFALGCP